MCELVLFLPEEGEILNVKCVFMVLDFLYMNILLNYRHLSCHDLVFGECK
jgi:hypothetical protein